MLDISEIPTLWLRFMNRWKDRDDRMDLIDVVMRGDFTEADPDDEDLVNRSPNMLQVALEDTADAASLVPSVRVRESNSSDEAREKAAAMERIAVGYLDRSQIELLTQKSNQDLAGFGFHTWVVEIDRESGSPVIKWRDPRFVYPEPGWMTMDSTRRVLIGRQLPLSSLPPDYEAKIRIQWDPQNNLNDPKVVLVEYRDEKETLIGGLYREGSPATIMGHQESYIPVLLDRIPNDTGICPLVIGQRQTFDNEPRGQFDQVINMMGAHIRLMALVLDYADQAVYSDMWVRDLIGQLPFGGGAAIQLGPNGQVGRVPPAVTSMSVYQEMQQLIDHIHLAARWPKVRPGEVDQAIASAKFVEATAGMMNTVIRSYHQIMKRSLEQAIRLCFVLDKKQNSGRKRAVAGVLRNQQFLMEYDPADIDLDASIRVEYGLGLGRDPAQSMVLAIQGHQAGFFSRDFVMENFEGITDVELERTRLDIQQLKDMALAQLLEGLQSKTIPPDALVDIARARQGGADIFEVFNKYVAKPAQEMMDQQLALGDGSMAMPGLQAPPEGGAVPEAPAPEGLLAMLGAGEPPVEATSRLNLPLGDGSFAGTNVG